MQMRRFKIFSSNLLKNKSSVIPEMTSARSIVAKQKSDMLGINKTPWMKLINI